MEINKIVVECLKQHEGGEKFFDALDDMIRRDDSILREMCDKINEYINDMDIDYIICSGKFGRVFATYYNENYTRMLREQCSLIVVSGGLRKGVEIEDFDCYVKYSNLDYIFVDDSFYSGKTRDVVRDKIKEYGGDLYKTFVVYDGSKEKDDSVDSMYRYYDNH